MAVVAFMGFTFTDRATAQSIELGNWRGPSFGAVLDVRNTQDLNRNYFVLGEKPALLATAIAGYHWQSGPLVAGFEAEVSRGTSEATYTHDNQANVSARARLGLSLGRALVYATAGQTWARDHGATVNYFGAAPDPLQSLTVYRSSFATGRVIGGGVEISFSPTTALRGDVLFTRFGEHRLVFPSFGPFGEVGLTTSYTDVSVRLGVMYRPFNGERGKAGSEAGRVDWSGSYAGLHGGLSVRHNDPDPFVAFFSRVGVYNAQERLGSVGIHAGHLWNVGAFVMGPETRISMLEYGNHTAALQWRVGLPLNGSLLYGAIGWMQALGTLHESGIDEIVSARHQGLFVSLGAETMIARKWSLRLDASVFDGRRATYKFNGTQNCHHGECPWIGSPPRASTLLDQSIQVGLSYHFK